MQAIETLTHEHQLIEGTLDALVAFSDEVHHRRSPGDKDELRRFVTFLREFVDECHHGKEEQILFAAIKAHGISGPHGPVSIMLHEHEQGRAMLVALDNFARQTEAWSDDDRAEVANLAITYVALMRQHIRKEDTILYPMATARLPAQAKAELAQQLERFAQLELGRGAHERLYHLAESLIMTHRWRAA